ncbi:hypothetical protein NHX12_024419 [Muraenolepis orangiensis]|uniref:Uncharacterized protein n=1 Tax=Muraenolepis orangiensis TaxID=630683 RepID=A0A9Q0EL06_9TELE|nr:hypothetical protein NHX12_024419 [Muraenolepis orangiensis]
MCLVFIALNTGTLRRQTIRTHHRAAETTPGGYTSEKQSSESFSFKRSSKSPRLTPLYLHKSPPLPGSKNPPSTPPHQTSHGISPPPPDPDWLGGMPIRQSANRCASWLDA